MADFYSGYNDARARQEKSTMADLQALTGAQALMGHMQEQQAKAGALKRQQAAMSALSSLGADATSEQRLAAIMPHLNPEQAAPLLQSDVTHRGNRENTRQIALARIAQQNDKLDQDYALGMAKITDANQKRGFDEWYKRSKIALEAEARAQGADKSFYETGFRRPGVDLPPMPSAQGAMPAVLGSAPNEAAAVAAINAGGGRPMSLEIPTVQNAGPQAQTPDAGRSPDAALPAPAVPAPSVQPADAANLDARDLRARGQAAFEAARNPAGSAPTPGPTPSQAATQGAPAVAMPQFVGSPKEQAAARNKWLLEQQKLSQKMTVNLAGGRESAQNNRVLAGGNQVAAALKNIVELPITGASTGIFGERGHPKGLIDAGKETLANTMTTQEVNDYKIMATGIERSLAAIESSGLAPSGALTNQMGGVVWREGWTNFSKLRALAETRQIVEKGLEVQLHNPRVPEETKVLVRKVIDDVQKAVPFTNQDLTKLQQEQGVDPKITLGDVVKSKQAGGAWDDSKEKRYQELLRKQRGGT